MFIINIVKKLFYSASGVLAYLSLAVPAFAQQNVNPCDAVIARNNPISVQLCKFGLNPSMTIQNIIVFFVVLAVIIALLYLVYGGIKWITSRGEKTEVEAARNHIIAAIVGLIVVFLAVFIVTIVLGVLGITLGQLEIPKLAP